MSKNTIITSTCKFHLKIMHVVLFSRTLTNLCMLLSWCKAILRNSLLRFSSGPFSHMAQHTYFAHLEFVPSGFHQSLLNQGSSNQDGFQVGTIDTLYSVLSLTLIGESHL